MSLDDRQVVVIGSSSGMGLATAKAAAKSGANVTLVSRSPEALARAVVEVGQGTRSIVADITDERFFSGFSAWKPVPGTALIAAVDGALAAFCRSLSVELAPIRVNTIAPGVVDTLMWQGVPETQRKAFFTKISEQLPVGRMGSLEDMADAAIYLMQSSFITGTVLHVDGGHRLI